MKPGKNLATKIFLDGGDSQETKKIIELLGFLDGQTTNPTLIAKNPEAKARLATGKKFSATEIYDFYRTVVKEISQFIPHGSVSIEVYADPMTRADAMFLQAKEMFSWIPNAHIKFPTTREGLDAARQALSKGLRVNMTLCFSQDQAASVFAATIGAKRGNVFISPFIGRLDDKGRNGMDVIANILRMYKDGDGHVQVLTASVRNLAHFMEALRLGSDIITAPFAILQEWGKQGMPLPPKDFTYDATNLAPIVYQELDLTKEWESFNLAHELTDQGIQRFCDDWKSLI